MGFFNPLKKSLGAKILKKGIASDPVGSKTIGGKLTMRALGGGSGSRVRNAAGGVGSGNATRSEMREERGDQSQRMNRLAGGRTAGQGALNYRKVTKVAPPKTMSTGGNTPPVRSAMPRNGNTGVVGPRPTGRLPTQIAPTRPINPLSRRRGI